MSGPDTPDRAFLEELYARFNRRAYVHPDPLEFLYEYEKPGDREVVGLLSACLAYGRVGQILRGVRALLDRLGPEPASWLAASRPSRIRSACEGFRHRVTSDQDMARLLLGVRKALRVHGSLQACFLQGVRDGDAHVLPPLGRFVDELGGGIPHLLPHPARGSACKRLNLFLRWMVRCDQVDPGGWDAVPRDKLLVPLDTHMKRIGLAWGFTTRRTPGAAMAVDVTDGFRQLNPEDPVKYDFALTRFGIRGEMDAGALRFPAHPGPQAVRDK